MSPGRQTNGNERQAQTPNGTSHVLSAPCCCSASCALSCVSLLAASQAAAMLTDCCWLGVLGALALLALLLSSLARSVCLYVCLQARRHTSVLDSLFHFFLFVCCVFHLLAFLRWTLLATSFHLSLRCRKRRETEAEASQAHSLTRLMNLWKPVHISVVKSFLSCHCRSSHDVTRSSHLLASEPWRVSKAFVMISPLCPK